MPPIRLRSNATLQPASSLDGHDVACTYKVTHADKKTYPQYDLYPSGPVFDSSASRSVPSLVVVCVRRLVPLVHELDESMLQGTWVPRRYETMKEVVHDLLPSILFDEPVDGHAIDAALSTIHPNRWLLLHLLVVPSSLPPALQRYTLPLSDTLLPLLQMHPAINSSNFDLITALFLGDNDVTAVNDDNITTLQALHHLAILDTSGTQLTSRGIRRFASTLRRVDDEGFFGEAALRGPWRLRVWNLRRTYVDDAIFIGDLGLQKWPLLCAVGEWLIAFGLRTSRLIDIRQTKCTQSAISLFRRNWGRKSTTTHAPFFDPTPPLKVLSNLVTLLRGQENRLAQTEFALLLIDRLDHPTSDPTNPSGPLNINISPVCADPATLVLTDESIIHGTVTDAREEIVFRTEYPKMSPLMTMSGMPLGRRRNLVSPRLLVQEPVFRRHLVALPPACNDFLLWRTPPLPDPLEFERPQRRAETGSTLRPNSENCHTEKRKRANDETIYVVKKVKPNPHDLFRPRMVGRVNTGSQSSDSIGNTNPFAPRSFS
jgi:hypothetical protein